MKIQTALLLTAGLLIASASTVSAADGVILIDQNRALAGNITPGDDPGFPVTLTRPGSYKLTSNLVVPQGDGFVLAADDVTIDFNGFTLTGAAAVQDGEGFTDRGQTHTRVTIRNGTITNFGAAIFLVATSRVEIREMRLKREGTTGPVVHVGLGAIIKDNFVEGAEIGISTNGFAVIADNVVRNTKLVGINTGCPSTVIGNVVQSGQAAFRFFGPSGTCTLANNALLAPNLTF